jgi:hypothetical protein
MGISSSSGLLILGGALVHRVPVVPIAVGDVRVDSVALLAPAALGEEQITLALSLGLLNSTPQRSGVEAL